MQSFLEEVAAYLLKKYPDITGELCIVTPNRRAGLFLRRHISSALTKPIWAPDILSIEDFINRISGLEVCDSLTLLLELYSVYKALEKDPEDLDSFIKWAPGLLRDFDEMDGAMAPRKELYAYIRDIRYIETWNPDGSPLTPFQQNYLGFIEKMDRYHQSLATRLTAKGMGWQGLSSRLAAERLGQQGGDTIPWKKIIFTGFNALTKAEEQIIQHLLEQGKADYLMDDDPYYTDDPDHEAGHFIRKYRKRFKLETPKKESCFSGGEKNIHVLGIAKQVNQARLAGNLLQHGQGISLDEQTAVVLADEHLLIPMLSALPEKLTDLNVTMGYPLSKTNMFGFFDAIFQLYIRAISGKQASDKKIAWHHKDLQRLFSHSNSRLLFDDMIDEGGVAELRDDMNRSNQLFISYEALLSLTPNPDRFSEAFFFLEQDYRSQPAEIFAMLLQLVGTFDRLFRKKAAMQGGDIVNTPFFADFESLYYFAKLFRRMEAFSRDFSIAAPLKTFWKLFRQVSREIQIPFSGEPLKGLQLMGMLETRSLDFNNIIILSANEQIIPKPKNSHSFIPYEVKKRFGIRLSHEVDAIYAYHFYRLLQRAKNVYLIYNTQSEDIGSSEKSRFITQLQYELPSFNEKMMIREAVISLPPEGLRTEKTLSITKTDHIMERLKHMASRGLSPSALSKFINCPMQFYLEKIARLEESEALEETLEASTLGSIAHGVLEELYRPFAGQVLQFDHLEAMNKGLEKKLLLHFQQEYRGGNISTGKNHLLYHLFHRYLINYLSAEKKHLGQIKENGQELTMLKLEHTMRGDLTIDNPEVPIHKVHITGNADRIDRMGNTIRVLDYKTGNVKDNELKFGDWQTPFVSASQSKSFQLLVYAWLYRQDAQEECAIEPGIISLRKPGKSPFHLEHPGGGKMIEEEEIADIERELKTLISTILNPSIPFHQTEDEENCTYCAFKKICNR